MKKTKTVLINKKPYEVMCVAYDGCHKIYLIQTDEDLEYAKSSGYEEGDFYPPEAIQEIYYNSCPLKFISTTTPLKMVIDQAYNKKVTVKVVG